MHLFRSRTRVAALAVPAAAVVLMVSCSETTGPLLEEGEPSPMNVPEFISGPLQSLYSLSPAALAAAAEVATEDAASGKRWCGGLGWFDPAQELCSGHGQPAPYGSVSTTDAGEIVVSTATSKAAAFLWTGPPTRVNPFPATGDFTLDVRMKVDAMAVYGAGLSVTGWDPAITEGTNNPSKGRVIQIWADNAAKMRVDLLGVSVRIWTWRDWHSYRLVYEDGAYTLFIDEQYAAGPIVSPLRPTAIWLGNPVFLTAARDWSDFRVSQITVSTPAPDVLPVGFDVKPGGCPSPINVRARGVVPVAIAGGEDFDVSEIDPTTLRLSRFDPATETLEGEIYPVLERWGVEDVMTPAEPFAGKSGEHCTADGADGYDDMTVKFSNEDVVKLLGEVENGEERTLVLQGMLQPDFGGTAIRGEDVVVIRK